MINYKPGDIFSFPIHSEEFGFGRILLDVYAQGIKPSKIDKQSPIYFTDNTILVELYKNTHKDPEKLPNDLEPLVSGIFTSNGFIVSNDWNIIDFNVVQPTTIDFPEFVAQKGAFSSIFIKGELKQEIELPFVKMNEIAIKPKSFPGIMFGPLMLYNLGRKEEIQLPNINARSIDLAHLDVRFSPSREEIHSLLPIEFNNPYDELSKMKGFDIKRFYTS
ncbi:MAG: Imm26 family immunity protein [Flavobacteriaceae bacterium]